jgi:hypothetical protein
VNGAHTFYQGALAHQVKMTSIVHPRRREAHFVPFAIGQDHALLVAHGIEDDGRAGWVNNSDPGRSGLLGTIRMVMIHRGG